jgi:plasmid stability protein
VIRNLPVGTKAALRARAQQHARSVEAEARELLAAAVRQHGLMLVDLLSVDEGAEIEFEPDRLGRSARAAEL